MGAEWKRWPMLDCEEMETELGTYSLVRTVNDVSVLRLNGETIARCSSGGHEANRKRAQEHYERARKA